MLKTAGSPGTGSNIAANCLRPRLAHRSWPTKSIADQRASRPTSICFGILHTSQWSATLRRRQPKQHSQHHKCPFWTTSLRTYHAPTSNPNFILRQSWSTQANAWTFIGSLLRPFRQNWKIHRDGE